MAPNRNEIRHELREAATGRTDASGLAETWKKRLWERDDVDARDFQRAYAEELANARGASRERLRALKMDVADRQRILLDTAGVVIEPGTGLSDVNALLPYGYAILEEGGRALLPSAGRMTVTVREQGGKHVLFVDGKPLPNVIVRWGDARRYEAARKRDESNQFYRSAVGRPVPAAPLPVPRVDLGAKGLAETGESITVTALVRRTAEAVDAARADRSSARLGAVAAALADVNSRWQDVSASDRKALEKKLSSAFFSATSQYDTLLGWDAAKRHALTPATDSMFELGSGDAPLQFYPFLKISQNLPSRFSGPFEVGGVAPGTARTDVDRNVATVRAAPGDVVEVRSDASATADVVFLRRAGGKPERLALFDRPYASMDAKIRTEYVKNTVLKALPADLRSLFSVDPQGRLIPDGEKLSERLSTGKVEDVSPAAHSIFEAADLLHDIVLEAKDGGIVATFSMLDGRKVVRTFLPSAAAVVSPVPSLTPAVAPTLPVSRDALDKRVAAERRENSEAALQRIAPQDREAFSIGSGSGALVPKFDRWTYGTSGTDFRPFGNEREANEQARAVPVGIPVVIDLDRSRFAPGDYVLAFRHLTPGLSTDPLYLRLKPKKESSKPKK